MSKEELIQMAIEKGFARADTITPAHIIDCTNPRIVKVPDKVFIYADTLGNIFYKDISDSKGCADLKEINHPTNTWSGMIYSQQNGKWAKIISYRENVKVLTSFPTSGVCWNPNISLLNHLKNRSNSQSGMSINGNNLAGRGLAWNSTGMWVVANKSSQPEYSIEELMRHISPKIPDNLVGYLLTPQECYLPEKWCTRITPENVKVLSKFLIENKEKYEKYLSDWNPEHAIGLYFVYPQADLGAYATTHQPKNHFLIDSKQIIHVLTSKKQISNTLNPEENGKHQEGETTSIKVCRSNLSVRRGEEIRATTVRCPKGKIRFGSSDS